MKKYITPSILKYQSVDDLLKNNNRNNSLFDTGENLSIDMLMHENFLCIVGEPGIGKSRLVAEIRNLITEEKSFLFKASEHKFKFIPLDIEYCIIDALDEVEGSEFYSTLQEIKLYRENNPNTKLLFTCRKHYVSAYAKHFDYLKGLTFIEICRLSDNNVSQILNNCSITTKESVTKSPKLKELLAIPRYLTFLLEYEDQERGISNISDLFEFIISKSIQDAIKAGKKDRNIESIRILIQRVLEKVAFIMEICRKDHISKDELYSILDGVRGNMTQMLVANFDLLFFESRILKDTNGSLEFENTEIQEYLASKELCRQDNIESVLYDIAVQKDLKHIYPNWYDVIPHISYTEDKIHTFINVIKLIVSYESSLENDSFESLLRYVDSSVFLPQQREELFVVLFEHYLRTPAYIGWKSQILKLIQECYDSRYKNILMPPVEQSIQLNKIQLANINAILEVIVKENKLDSDVFNYWTNIANIFIADDNEEKKLAGLNLYDALKDNEKLVLLSENYNSFGKDVKNKFLEITGHRRFTSKAIIDCWLNGCYEGNPYAINAILYIEDSSAMVYAYNRIISENKLHEFFNPNGALSVFYEFDLKKQFNIAWGEDLESKILITKIIAQFVDQHSHVSQHEIDNIVKQILLEERTGMAFIECFDKEWSLQTVLTNFDAEHIDAELLSAIDNLLHKSNMEDRHVDIILTTLVNRIRNDASKRETISQYLTRYAETFERWDKNSKVAKTEQINPQLLKAYKSLSNPNVSKYIKYDNAFTLSKNIEFLHQQDLQPFMDVIDSFFDEVDLDKLKLEKNDDVSFSISTLLVVIPYYVKAMNSLGFHDCLRNHRIVLAKTLPFNCCTANFDSNEIRSIYKSVIGSISEKEKTELVNWWKSRKDDLMNISSDGIFTCIIDYGMDALSYKLEEYLNDYIIQQDISHRFAASRALELISEGHLSWDVSKYRNLFHALKDDDIEGVKMQCNHIMIEKYQDLEAIEWRFEYIKKNVVSSLHNDTGHAQAISHAESEMLSPNPQMFKCFKNIKCNEKLIEKMFDLFDFALKLCVTPNTQEYSSYILKQVYNFFINADNTSYLSKLRKKVEIFNTSNVSYLANGIMNSAEITYLQKEKNSIYSSIKQYNKCIEESHLEIRNNDDLRRYFSNVYCEVQKEIQDQGIYSLVRQENLNEDFIQRELKNTIINKCCLMGLDTIQVDREVTLQDNKRTDLLVRYGFCNPIMVELKLLHNNEIQITKQRHEYKRKFIQYTKATNACLSVFWVFDVHRRGGDIAKFRELELEYKDIDNTIVLLTDCKCNSGIDTGLSPNRHTSRLSKKSKVKSR